jgi:hypothetical protein
MATAATAAPAARSSQLLVRTRFRNLGRNLAWVLVTAAHLMVFPYSARLNNPNENVRVWTTKALVDHRTFKLDETEREWGFVDDKVAVGGHTYSSKAPGLSLLGVPIYFVQSRALKLAGARALTPRAATLGLRMFAVALPLGLFLWAFSRYVERMTASSLARDLSVVGLGLGSLLYPYGVIFVGHAHGAALAFASFMLLAPATGAPVSRRGLVAAGVCAGAAVLFEYQVIVAAAALAAFALHRHRRGVGWMLLGAAPPALLLAVYHTAVFGKPWDLPWAHVQNAGFAAYHAHGFLGLTAPRPDAIAAMLFAPELGLYVFSPYLAVGTLGALGAALLPGRRRAEGIVVLAASAGMLLFTSSLTFWRGGWCAGPRYVTVLAPFLTIGIALAWGRIGRSLAATAVLGGLVIASVFMNAVSAALFPHFPPQLRNPIFQLALPLVGRGFVPYGFGRLLGLPGAWSLAPVAAVVVAAVALALRAGTQRTRRRALRAGLSVVVAVAFLLPLSRYARTLTSAETQAVHVVEEVWEPPPPRPPPPAPAPRPPPPRALPRK